MNDHLVPLGDTGWLLWRDSVLRGAGFTTDYVRRLACPEVLSDSADVDAAVARSSAALKRIASDPRFLEAVTWQNPALVRNVLRNVDPADGKRVQRKNRQVIANYVQRYATKNDTIGFFGPVGWAAWTDGDDAVSLDVGPKPLAMRTVYFESWAIDAVAKVLSGDPELVPWLRPRLVASCLLDGSTLRRAYGRPIELSKSQAALLARCDGHRTVRELGAEALPQLIAWRDARILHLGFEGPIEARPEVALRRTLGQIGEAGLRARALRTLDELVTARDAVTAAAGDPYRLLDSVEKLHETFERITGQASKRRHGQPYAGRTVVYEDTCRGTSALLGRPLMDALAPPLALLLTSARWLVGRVGELYHRTLLELFEVCRARAGTETVPLATLLARATPYFVDGGGPAQPLAAAIAELQEKWAGVLEVPQGARRHTVAAEDIRERVLAEFPHTGRRWATAVHYAPDVLLAAADLAALNAGDFTVVIGELHLTVNTIESRLFVRQHPDPARLLAASEADHGGRRVYSVPAKEWPQVNSRTYPADLLSAEHTYWCLHADSVGAPGRVLPAAGLTVARAGETLVVQTLAGDLQLDLLEVLGEQLSAAVVNGFLPVPSARHVPRTAIDRVVFQRETWNFEPDELGWAWVKQEAERLRLAQAWRLAEGIPVRAFYKVPSKRKPVFVDFTSPPLVDLFAKAARNAEAGTVKVTEMLPDRDQTWLDEGRGGSCTAELRLVVVDPEVARSGKEG